MAYVAVMQEVELHGRLLKRAKTITVADGRKKEKMTEHVDFLANAFVISVSGERSNRWGVWRSLLVKLAGNKNCYVLCHENRHEAARIQPGSVVSFEGHLVPGGNNMLLKCTAFYMKPLTFEQISSEQFAESVENPDF